MIGDNMDNIYAIIDVEGYANEMREAAAKSIADPFDDDLNNYISIGQMVNLIYEECIGIDKECRPLVNEDSNEKIYESTMTWIYNVGLAKLAAKNLIECAWDSTDKEFIFWSLQQENNQYEQGRNSTKNH